MVSAVPGIVIALLIAVLMKEPARSDGRAPRASRAKIEKGTVLGLLRNKPYLCSILGYAAVTFSLGGISWWMPSFLQRVDGRSQSSAAFVMGAITVATGLLGTIVGGVWAQRWSKNNPKALFLVPAIGSLLAVPPAVVCFFGPQLFGTRAFTLPGLAMAVFMIFLGTGPVNASTINAVRPEVRATAMAGQLFIIHALGDAISPRIIGVVSDRSNLAVGLGSTLITLVLASAIFFLGSKVAPRLTQVEGAVA